MVSEESPVGGLTQDGSGHVQPRGNNYATDIYIVCVCVCP